MVSHLIMLNILCVCDDNRFYFVIACHNSANKLPVTLVQLLKHVPPEQIIIADNGSKAYVLRLLQRQVSVEV